MNALSHRRSASFSATRRATLSDAFELYRQRRALARLDDRALEDIGLTREEARAEANRPFWDVFRR